MRGTESDILSTSVKVLVAALLGGLAILAVVCVGLVLLVQAVLAPKNGNAMADGMVGSAARALTESLGYGRQATDAESLAAERFARASTQNLMVQPYSWTGTMSGSDRITIEVRIRAEVAASDSGGQLFGPSNTAGSAERCYRFMVPMSDYAAHIQIPCPESSAVVPIPTATPDPALATDAEARLTAVLQSSHGTTLSDDVRAAFPEADVTTDAAATSAGELVAAVGVARARDCVVLVRHADGAIERIWFDRIQLEPGEGGCSVELYTHPAL